MPNFLLKITQFVKRVYSAQSRKLEQGDNNTKSPAPIEPKLTTTKTPPDPVPEARGKSSADKEKKARTSDPRKPLKQGAMVEAYKLDRVVGRGSFSLVYRGIDTRSKSIIIAKEYYPKRFAERETDGKSISPLEGKKLIVFDEGHKQFYKEAMVLRKVKHPNIIRSIDLFRANKTTYMIAPSTGGHDLKWFLRKTRKPINQDLLYKIFMPILSALNFLHAASLLHLDLKPANILLQPKGESLLLDLGAAQTISSKFRVNNFQTLTHGFAPHEQYDKNKALGPWTDMYAVAASLYCCITTRPPKKSTDKESQSQLNIDELGDKFSPALLEAINKSLSYHASDRYDDIDLFASDLLKGSSWKTLHDYEREVMDYNRFQSSTFISQKELVESFST